MQVIVLLNLCTSVVLSASNVSVNFLWVHHWNPLIHSGRETLSPSTLCCVWAQPFSHDWQTSIWTARIKPINHIKLEDKKKKRKGEGEKNQDHKFNWEHSKKIEVKKYRRPLLGYRKEALLDLVSDDSINSYQMTAGVKYQWGYCKPWCLLPLWSFRGNCAQSRTTFAEEVLKSSG